MQINLEQIQRRQDLAQQVRDLHSEMQSQKNINIEKGKNFLFYDEFSRDRRSQMVNRSQQFEARRLKQIGSQQDSPINIVKSRSKFENLPPLNDINQVYSQFQTIKKHHKVFEGRHGSQILISHESLMTPLNDLERSSFNPSWQQSPVKQFEIETPYVNISREAKEFDHKSSQNQFGFQEIDDNDKKQGSKWIGSFKNKLVGPNRPTPSLLNKYRNQIQQCEQNGMQIQSKSQQIYEKFMHNGSKKSGKQNGVSKTLKAKKRATFGLFTKSINIEEAKVIKANKYIPSINQSFDQRRSESTSNLMTSQQSIFKSIQAYNVTNSRDSVQNVSLKRKIVFTRDRLPELTQSYDQRLQDETSQEEYSQSDELEQDILQDQNDCIGFIDLDFPPEMKTLNNSTLDKIKEQILGTFMNSQRKKIANSQAIIDLTLPDYTNLVIDNTSKALNSQKSSNKKLEKIQSQTKIKSSLNQGKRSSNNGHKYNGRQQSATRKSNNFERENEYENIISQPKDDTQSLHSTQKLGEKRQKDQDYRPMIEKNSIQSEREALRDEQKYTRDISTKSQNPPQFISVQSATRAQISPHCYSKQSQRQSVNKYQTNIQVDPENVNYIASDCSLNKIGADKRAHKNETEQNGSQFHQKMTTRQQRRVSASSNNTRRGHTTHKTQSYQSINDFVSQNVAFDQQSQQKKYKAQESHRDKNLRHQEQISEETTSQNYTGLGTAGKKRKFSRDLTKQQFMTSFRANHYNQPQSNHQFRYQKREQISGEITQDGQRNYQKTSLHEKKKSMVYVSRTEDQVCDQVSESFFSRHKSTSQEKLENSLANLNPQDLLNQSGRNIVVNLTQNPQKAPMSRKGRKLKRSESHAKNAIKSLTMQQKRDNQCAQGTLVSPKQGVNGPNASGVITGPVLGVKSNLDKNLGGDHVLAGVQQIGDCGPHQSNKINLDGQKNNLLELQRNVMHIKKLHFIGRPQNQQQFQVQAQTLHGSSSASKNKQPANHTIQQQQHLNQYASSTTAHQPHSMMNKPAFMYSQSAQRSQAKAVAHPTTTTMYSNSNAQTNPHQNSNNNPVNSSSLATTAANQSNLPVGTSTTTGGAVTSQSSSSYVANQIFHSPTNTIQAARASNISPAVFKQQSVHLNSNTNNNYPSNKQNNSNSSEIQMRQATNGSQLHHKKQLLQNSFNNEMGGLGSGGSLGGIQTAQKCPIHHSSTLPSTNASLFDRQKKGSITASPKEPSSSTLCSCLDHQTPGALSSAIGNTLQQNGHKLAKSPLPITRHQFPLNTQSNQRHAMVHHPDPTTSLSKSNNVHKPYQSQTNTGGQAQLSSGSSFVNNRAQYNSNQNSLGPLQGAVGPGGKQQQMRNNAALLPESVHHSQHHQQGAGRQQQAGVAVSSSLRGAGDSLINPNNNASSLNQENSRFLPPGNTAAGVHHSQATKNGQNTQNQNLNPLMNDLLGYLQQVHMSRSRAENTSNSVQMPKSTNQQHQHNQVNNGQGPIAPKIPGAQAPPHQAGSFNKMTSGENGVISAALTKNNGANGQQINSPQLPPATLLDKNGQNGQNGSIINNQSSINTTSQNTNTTTNNNDKRQFQLQNKFFQFERGDKIIFEPNETHQLKYVNEKGEVSPIMGVQYILTQPNFSRGRPCHFFVVNRQEFEAATGISSSQLGGALNNIAAQMNGQQAQQQPQSADKSNRLGANMIGPPGQPNSSTVQRNVAAQNANRNLRSNRMRPKGSVDTTTSKRNVKVERRQSAKGDREKGAASAGPHKHPHHSQQSQQHDEKNKEKDANKYYNETYTYQKLKSLKWMGGVYKREEDNTQPMWKPSQEEKELQAQIEQKREIKAKYNLLSLNKQQDGNVGGELYKWICNGGNNHEVVKRVMETRPSWTQIKSSQTLYQFKWAPISRQIKFDFLCKHGQRNLVNHFENHALISTKDQIFFNMMKFCENLHQDVFKTLPLTFVIDLSTFVCQQEFDKFVHYFNMIEKQKHNFDCDKSIKEQSEALTTLNKQLVNYFQMGEKKRSYTQYSLRDCMFTGKNLWLLKPADANRGRGVHIFESIDQLKKLLLELTTRADSRQFQQFATNSLGGKPQQQPSENNASNHNIGTASAIVGQSEEESAEMAASQGQNNAATGGVQTSQAPNAHIKADVFVIQKYIEKPLLVCKRKFDIRLWVLVTQEHRCHYFREGYIRTSSSEYSLGDVDRFIHLTNNAIQKHDVNYGSFAEGNILSFNEASEYLKKTEDREVDFYKLLKDQMVPQMELTLTAVRQKLNKNNRRFCFEIFGYDFMVDDLLNTWLIEVNTNPCLEESNKLLKQLLPRMLDDAFKLTVDAVHPPMSLQKLEQLGIDPPDGKQQFKVPGYDDNMNMWGDQPFYMLRAPNFVTTQGS